MRSIPVLFCLLLVLAPGAGAVLIAQYDFTGEPGDQVSTAADTVNYGFTATSITRGPGLQNDRKRADSMNSRSWPTATTLPNTDSDYYTFTLTPADDYTWNLTQLVFGQRGNKDGPLHVEVRTSQDDYATSVDGVRDISRDVASTLTFSLSSLNDIASDSPLTVRIYAYESNKDPEGQWALENGTAGGLTVYADVVPEPGSALLLFGAMATALGRRRRRRTVPV